MHHRTSKLFDTRHIRPARLIQNPCRTDQNITNVTNDVPTRKILNIHTPTPFTLIPLSPLHLMPRPNELLEPIFLRKRVQVLMHLFARGVDTARARVRFEAVGVVVCREIACYPVATQNVTS